MEDDSEFDIAITSVCEQPPGLDRLLRTAITTALLRHKAQAARISVALVDDARISELNETHLDHKGPTDVISFDLRDQDDVKADGGRNNGTPIDGEVVVCVDAARREAEQRRHDVSAELALYAVHGTLHLLGYDDKSEEDAARMHEIEDDILVSIGLGPVSRRESR
jgi:probable rRNA maturation factor